MKIAVLIDGDTTKVAANGIDLKIDWAKVKRIYGAVNAGTDVATLAYFATAAVDRDGHSSVRKLLDFVDYQGYRMHVVEFDTDRADTFQPARTALVVELALEIAAAADSGADMIVIWSNDGAIAPAVQAAQRAGAFVRVVAVKEGTGACADDLRRAADAFDQLGNLRGSIMIEAKPSAVA